jgi:hypothetical protein
MPGSNEIAEFGEEQANTENLQIVTLKVSEKDILNCQSYIACLLVILRNDSNV